MYDLYTFITIQHLLSYIFILIHIYIIRSLGDNFWNTHSDIDLDQAKEQ